MNLKLIIGSILFSLIIAGIGGGVAYWVWIRTRKKKETWNARIYQLGDGIRTVETDKDGKKVETPFKLKDLKCMGKDILEKIEKEPGITVYRLQKRNRTTPEVNSGYVEYWSNEDREVDVLFFNGSYTLMKKGYDSQTGDIIFNPMPLSRINMMKSEMAIRKDRLVKEKDILQAITPWIVAGMAMLTLVALFYLGVQGMVEISENLAEATENTADKMPSPQGNTESHAIESLGSQPAMVEGG